MGGVAKETDGGTVLIPGACKKRTNGSGGDVRSKDYK